jgi:hypothetical protein
MNRRGTLRATVNVTSSDGLVSMGLVLPLIRWVGEGGAGDDLGVTLPRSQARHGPVSL